MEAIKAPTAERPCVARLADGTCVVAIVGQPRSHLSLYLSSGERPESFADFRPPILLAGDGGIVASDGIHNLQMVVQHGDLLNLCWQSDEGRSIVHARRRVASAQKQLISQAEGWDVARVAPPGGRSIRLLDAVSDPPGDGLSLLLASGGQYRRLVRLDVPTGAHSALLQARQRVCGGRLLFNSQGSEELVWWEAHPESSRVGPLRHACRHDGRWQTRTLSECALFFDALVLPDGKLLVVWNWDEHAYAAWRSEDGWHGPSHEPLFDDHFSALRLGLDGAGTAWLLYHDNYWMRPRMLLRRWLGKGFSESMEVPRGSHYHEPDIDNTSKVAYGRRPGWGPEGPYTDMCEIERSGPATSQEMGLLYAVVGENLRLCFASTPAGRLRVDADLQILFLDLRELASCSGLLHRVDQFERHPGNPVLSAAGKAERGGECSVSYNTVLFERGQFRMWYEGTHNRWPNMDYYRKVRHVKYAESTDGVHWERPRLDLHPSLGPQTSNVVIPHTCCAWIARDETDRDANRRYKMYTYRVEGSAALGSWLYCSADGLNWSGRCIYPYLPGIGWPLLDPLSTLLVDADDPKPERRYKFYGQTSLPIDRRTPCVVCSGDLERFVAYRENPLLDSSKCRFESQIHGGCVTKYRGYYIMIYQAWPATSDVWDFHLKLAVSRDGLRFSRVRPEECLLAPGPEGAWDRTAISTPNHFLTLDNEIRLYYSAGPNSGRAHYPPKHIGFARLRLDGFAHLELAPGQKEGWLTTVPIECSSWEGLRLVVNVAGGDAKRPLLDAELLCADSSAPVPGFTLADSMGVPHEGTAVPITWRRHQALGGIRTSAVRIRLRLRRSGARSPQLYRIALERT